MTDIATLNAVLALVKILHRKKVIHIDELIAETGDLIDFADTEHLDLPDRAEQVAVYEALRRVGRMLHAIDDASAPDAAA